MYITSDQTKQLQDLISGIEARTGIELVAAVVGKCDSYPEIPWKAFALAASVGALAYLAAAMTGTGWTAAAGTWQGPLIILGAGSALALLSVFWPWLGRLFLDRLRAETEVEQYARAFFLERELFRAGNRGGILVLASLFERKAVILPDTGVAGRLDEKALRNILEQMAPHLRRKERFQAFVQGLNALEAELVKAGFGQGQKTVNEIPDAVIQEKGEDR